MSQDTVKIFGVTIDKIDYLRTIAAVGQWLRDSGEPKLIVTPNPEILLEARKNADYAEALNRADLRLPDGFGIRLVSEVNTTVHGADIATFVVRKAGAKKLRIACIVRADGLSTPEAVAEAVEQLSDGATVKSFAIEKGEWEQKIAGLTEFQPDVVLVGLGFPDQELWLDRAGRTLPQLRLGMAIGGTFDFWTGQAVRAPKGLRKLHLEWLWRVLRQPSRVSRIFRALVVFPVLALIIERK